MIEFFDIMGSIKQKNIRIKYNDRIHIRKTNLIYKFIQYVLNNKDLFFIEHFDLDYTADHIKSFDINIYTSNSVYENIDILYKWIIEEYDTRTIRLYYKELSGGN